MTPKLKTFFLVHKKKISFAFAAIIFVISISGIFLYLSNDDLKSNSELSDNSEFISYTTPSSYPTSVATKPTNITSYGVDQVQERSIITNWYNETDDELTTISPSDYSKIYIRDFGLYVDQGSESKKIITNLPVFNFTVSTNKKDLIFSTRNGLNQKQLDQVLYQGEYSMNFYIYNFESKRIDRINSEPLVFDSVSPSGRFLSFHRFVNDFNTKKAVFVYDLKTRSMVFTYQDDYGYLHNVDPNYNPLKPVVWDQSSDAFIITTYSKEEDKFHLTMFEFNDTTFKSKYSKEFKYKFDNFNLLALRDNLFVYSKTGDCNIDCQYSLFIEDLTNNSEPKTLTTQKEYFFQTNNKLISTNSNEFKFHQIDWNNQGVSESSKIKITEENYFDVKPIPENLPMTNLVSLQAKLRCDLPDFQGAGRVNILLDFSNNKIFYPIDPSTIESISDCEQFEQHIDHYSTNGSSIYLIHDRVDMFYSKDVSKPREIFKF